MHALSSLLHCPETGRTFGVTYKLVEEKRQQEREASVLHLQVIQTRVQGPPGPHELIYNECEESVKQNVNAAHKISELLIS